MSGLGHVLAACAIACAVNAASPASSEKEQRPRLALDLTDGSHIIGITALSSIPIKDAYIDTLKSFSGADEITVCGWVLYPEPPHDAAVISQLGQRRSHKVLALMGGSHTGGSSRMSAAIVANSARIHDAFSGTEVELKKWKHLCLTFARGKSLTLYEDGVPVRSVPVEDLPLGSTYVHGQTARIGSSQGADACWASGFIDEVMIFAMALSEEDVRVLYNSQK